jgi:hypothetical protein
MSGLGRPYDQAQSMSDLSFERDIFPRLADGTMPCDAPWSEGDVERVRRWIDAGMAA